MSVANRPRHAGGVGDPSLPADVKVRSLSEGLVAQVGVSRSISSCQEIRWSMRSSSAWGLGGTTL